MIVTKIQQQKKDPEKYNIYIDGEYAFALIMRDILYFKIKENMPIEEDKYNFIINETVYIKAQSKALDYLGYKMRTEYEIRRKLQEESYNEDVIERVVEFLKKYGYIDDLKYAQSYIRQVLRLKPMGSYGIKMKLREYGVKDIVIEEALFSMEIDEEEYAFELLKKKIGSKEDITDKEKKKYHDFLLRRGYSYDIIKSVFKKAEI